MVKEKRGLDLSAVMLYRNELYGLAAIAILFGHLNNYVSLLPSGTVIGRAVSFFLENGSIGADVFLFLSAIGLFASARKNRVTVFWRNRFQRIFLPYIICAVLFFAWYDFIAAKDGVLQFAFNATTLNYWVLGNPAYPLWYIAVTVVLYIAFPLLYRADRATHHLSTVALIVLDAVIETVFFKTGHTVYDLHEIVLSKLPIFFFGLLFAEAFLGEKKIPTAAAALITIAGLCAFAVRYLVDMPLICSRYCASLFAVSAVMTYSFIRSSRIAGHLGKLLAWVGSFSLELYIVHVLIIRVMKEYDLWRFCADPVWYAVLPALSVPVAWGLSRSCAAVWKKKRRKELPQSE